MKKPVLLAVLAILTLANLAAFIHASSPLTVNSGSITVTPAPGITLTSASLNSVSCPVSGGTTATCSGISSIVQGSSVLLSLTVNNPSQIVQSLPKPVVVFASTGTNSSAFLSVSPNQQYPLNVSPGSSSTVTFTIAASSTTTGSDSFSLQP